MIAGFSHNGLVLLDSEGNTDFMRFLLVGGLPFIVLIDFYGREQQDS